MSLERNWRHSLQIVFALVGLTLSVTCFAGSKPFAVSETYVERADVSGNLKKMQSTCSVQFTDIIDARRSKDMLGMMYNKPVHGPTDSIAWLKSALGGLGARGVTPVFGPDSAPSTGAVKAQASLMLVWISAGMNMVANVVVHIHAHRNGQPDIDKDFRGTESQMNWAGANGEIQATVDKAYGKLLDQIAPELFKLCSNA